MLQVENFLFYVLCDAATSRRDGVMAFFSKVRSTATPQGPQLKQFRRSCLMMTTTSPVSSPSLLIRAGGSASCSSSSVSLPPPLISPANIANGYRLFPDQAPGHTTCFAVSWHPRAALIRPRTPGIHGILGRRSASYPESSSSRRAACR